MVAEIADRVVVMYAGQIVENATLDEIFYDPQHPYTWGLLGSLMRLDNARTRLAQIPGHLRHCCRHRPVVGSLPAVRTHTTSARAPTLKPAREATTLTVVGSTRRRRNCFGHR